MYGFHESNVGVHGFFVWGEGVGDEGYCAYCALNGVEHGEPGENPHGGAFFHVVEGLPAGDIVRERDFFGEPEVSGEAIPHFLVFVVDEVVPVDGSDGASRVAGAVVSVGGGCCVLGVHKCPFGVLLVVCLGADKTRELDVGEGIKKFYEPVADGGDIFVVAHEFKTVEVGDVAFMGDEVPGGAVVGAEVGVAAGDNSANKCPVGGVIKEANDLDGDRARLSPVDTYATTVCGADEDVWFGDGEGSVSFLMGIRADGKPSL